MQLDLSHSIVGRHTEYPAAVISNLVVRAPTGQPHSRRWEGVIDTGADLTILPREIPEELRLARIPERVRVWSYHKDEPPREVDVFYVRLVLPTGLEVMTKAIVFQRRNILIGRSALARMRLMIDWPANRWSLEEASLPRTPAQP